MKKRNSGDSNVFAELSVAFKHYVWRRTQFLSSEKQRDKFIRRCLEKTMLEEFSKTNPMYKQNVRAFLAENAAGVVKMLNDKRSTVTGQIKKVCMEHCKQPNNVFRELPTEKQLLGCVTRDKDKDVDVMAWLWDKVYTQATGDSAIWSDAIRNFCTISEHIIVDDTATDTQDTGEPTHYITPALEAFAVVVILNNRSKWQSLAKLEMGMLTLDEQDTNAEGDDTNAEGETNTGSGDNNAEELMPDYSKGVKVLETKKPGKAELRGFRYIYADEHKEFQTKWSISNCGQKPFGGFAREGIQLYCKTRDLCDAARQKPENAAFEKEVLEKVRRLNGVRSGNWNEHRGMPDKKQRASDTTKDVVDELTDDDDSFATDAGNDEEDVEEENAEDGEQDVYEVDDEDE